MTDSLFGEVISRYTRAQAIADDVLIDVSDSEAARLFKYPAAITAALCSALSVGSGNEAATFNARLFDVFHMMRNEARNCSDSDLYFSVKVGSRVLELWGNCGPGDDPAPVLTIGFPQDR